MRIRKVAIVGTQGVPAQYGGFETLVENLIGKFKSNKVEYTVFCSGRDYKKKQKTYMGAKLKYIPFLHANGIQRHKRIHRTLGKNARIQVHPRA